PLICAHFCRVPWFTSASSARSMQGEAQVRAFFGSCAIALAALAIPAAAGAAGMTYDCDTAANHFSELNLPAPGAPFIVTGTVQLTALAASATYIPIARVQIAASAAPGQSPDGFAGFSLSA